MPTIAPNLTFHKRQATTGINQSIAAVRLKYITDIPGQQALYQRKELQAQRYKDAGYPADLTGFRLIAAEAGITAPTAQELADMWLQNAEDWETIAATLETIRMRAVVAITNATTRPQIDAAVTQCMSDLAALPG